eukprot:6238227-Lingulodinium_polyedra.AAC.1
MDTGAARADDKGVGASPPEAAVQTPKTRPTSSGPKWIGKKMFPLLRKVRLTVPFQANMKGAGI